MRSLNLGAFLLLAGAVFLGGCETTGSSDRASEKARASQEAQARQERIDTLREAIEARIRERVEAGRGESAPSGTVQERLTAVSASIQKQLQEFIAARAGELLGLPEPVEDETVLLEAVDADGVTREVAVVVETRPLRSLTAPSVARGALTMLSEPTIGPGLYAAVPDPLLAEDSSNFERIYAGEHAAAIATEARLIVTLKGGAWAEPEAGKKCANAIAVRGLDLSLGLKQNSNKTYDDTMYVIIESEDGPEEVFEYRMTTESSNSKRGVGRLKSKQVYYYRGLHRGKDPAFRLVGNAAAGTRVGQEGEFQITGANIHSAYTSRTITSETPLSPNVSLGCQVIAASQTRFESAFIAAMDTRGIMRFPYTIVEDKELRALDEILGKQGQQSILIRGLPR